MSSLKDLIAMQAKAKAPVKPAIPAEPSPVGTAEETPTPVAKPSPLAGLNLLKKSAATQAPAKPAAPKAADLPESFSLEDLAAFDTTQVEEACEVAVHSGFLDEIEATAPVRELSPDLTTQQLTFIEQLDGIYPVLHDPEFFAQSVRTVMIELQENPEYLKLICDHDVHTMIRGMRNSMGLARIKKQEKSRKGGGGRAAANKKTKGVSDDDLAMLDDLLGGSLD